MFSGSREKVHWESMWYVWKYGVCVVTNYEWKLNLIINETYYRKNEPTLIPDHLHFLLSFVNVCIFGDWHHLIYGTANQAYQWIENILIYECSSTKTTLLVALVTLASILLVSLKSELMILMWHYASNTLFIFYKHSVFFWISLSMLMIFLIWASLHYAYNMLKIMGSVITVMI